MNTTPAQDALIAQALTRIDARPKGMTRQQWRLRQRIAAKPPITYYPHPYIHVERDEDNQPKHFTKRYRKATVSFARLKPKRRGIDSMRLRAVLDRFQTDEQIERALTAAARRRVLKRLRRWREANATRTGLSVSLTRRVMEDGIARLRHSWRTRLAKRSYLND